MSRFLGLLLDTRFPRLPGDAGRPDSYAMPVRALVVPGATPQRVVRDGDPALPELASPGVLTVDVEGFHLQSVLLDNQTSLDPARALKDVLEAPSRLMQLRPQVQNLVLECTNPPPMHKPWPWLRVCQSTTS